MQSQLLRREDRPCDISAGYYSRYTQFRYLQVPQRRHGGVLGHVRALEQTTRGRATTGGLSYTQGDDSLDPSCSPGAL